WRTAIETRSDSVAATKLAQQIWEPIAAALPSGTTTLYLVADGDLARVPWAALPLSKDRVLLEDFVIAQVPHGTYLLEQFKFPRSITTGESLLAVGDIDYGAGRFPALPGTKIEVNAIAALAPGERVLAGGAEATTAKLSVAIPKASYAHLATHGEFKSEELAAE